MINSNLVKNLSDKEIAALVRTLPDSVLAAGVRFLSEKDPAVQLFAEALFSQSKLNEKVIEKFKASKPRVKRKAKSAQNNKVDPKVVKNATYKSNIDNIYRIIANSNGIRPVDIMNEHKIDRKTLFRALSRLLEDGKVFKVGESKTMFYGLTKDVASKAYSNFLKS